MSQTTSSSARHAALARRKALSTTGKAAMPSSAQRTREAPVAVAKAVIAAPEPSVTAVTPAAGYVPAPRVQMGVSRKAALTRRIAMSKGGKGSVASSDRTRSAPAKADAQNAVTNTASGSETNKQGCGCGCGGKKRDDAALATPIVDSAAAVSTALSLQAQQSMVKKAAMGTARSASLSRRKAMSAKGKSALAGGGVSEASAARAANPQLTSRELAQALRSQRAAKGKTGKKQSTAPTGPGRRRKVQTAAEDAPWKVGVTETASGQAVTGTMVDRTEDVTGNEASTCRSVTGTEYMGADVFKDYCQVDPEPAFNRVGITSTGTGNTVSGSSVGRSSKVTGDEPGTCKAVTGTEYVSAEQAQAFCDSKSPSTPAKISMAQTLKGKAVSGNNVGRSEKVTGDEPGSGRQLTGSQYMESADVGSAPAKVGKDTTLRGGSVSGTMVGRSEKVTGDEPGSCRGITGDDYVGRGQYGGFCQSAPEPKDQKVGVSRTMAGKEVTGTMTGRSGRVTGDEPGTCKAITGTPYAGAAEMSGFCSTDDVKAAEQRVPVNATVPAGVAPVGKPLTGLQPSVGGVMTGDSKGACEPVSGTPYVGGDQVAEACPAVAAQPNSPDFPQAVNNTAPWTGFSVSSPAGEAQTEQSVGAVTGNDFGQGKITGPFGMATGKVTGTEDARFGNKVMAEPVVAEVSEVEGRIKSRVTGEGMDTANKITGDDWDRGNNITGTEGASARQRNPTLRAGNAMAMVVKDSKRNEELPVPNSKVTGGSGNTEKGAFVTYSGGARG